MHGFRQIVAVLMVIVIACAAALPPAAAVMPAAPVGDITGTAVDNAACDDCTGDTCDRKDSCLGACARMPGPMTARLEAPVAPPIAPAADSHRFAGRSDFTSRAIRPLLPPPRV